MISTFADWIAAVHEAVIEVRKQEKMRPKPVYLGDLLQAKLELRRAQRSTWSHGAQTKCSIKDMEKVLGYSEYLFRKKILTFGSFNDYLIEVNSEVDSIKKNISAKEKRVWEINRAKKALSDYHELRPIYQEYASIRWKGRKEKFGAEHKAELDSYRRYVWMIRKLIPGGNADFDTRTMEKEASQLTDEIIPLKEKLSTRQGELKKLQEIRRFIKDVLPEGVSFQDIHIGSETDYKAPGAFQRVNHRSENPFTVLPGKVLFCQRKFLQQETLRPRIQFQHYRQIQRPRHPEHVRSGDIVIGLDSRYC